VEELEHKARRQDVLVDDELITPSTTSSCRRGVQRRAVWNAGTAQEAASKQPQLLHAAAREELMRARGRRHHHQRFPKTLRLGGVDCAADYLHEPGDAQGRR